jgi:hypothetical protein
MPVPTNTSGQAAAAAPPDRRQPWQGNPDTTPAVVLRSHYRQLHALLAIAMIAVVGLAAVVILATNDDRDTTRYDGGPEEGTRGPGRYAFTPGGRERAPVKSAHSLCNVSGGASPYDEGEAAPHFRFAATSGVTTGARHALAADDAQERRPPASRVSLPHGGGSAAARAVMGKQERLPRSPQW